MPSETDTSRGRAVSDQRVQSSLLSAPERAALNWIARRLPGWVGPDLLTVAGLAGLVLVGAAYLLAGRDPARRGAYLVLASVGLVVNWFGDSLDGTLARLRRRQRPMYGYYLDHLVDAFGVSFVLGGLTYSGLICPPVGTALLALYLIASINAYLATHTVGEFKISFARLSPTEGRVLLILLNTTLIFWTRFRVAGREVLLLDVLGVLGGAALLVLVLRSAVGHLVRLDREERARWPEAPVSPEGATGGAGEKVPPEAGDREGPPPGCG